MTTTLGSGHVVTSSFQSKSKSEEQSWLKERALNMIKSEHLSVKEKELVSVLLGKGRKSEATAIVRVYASRDNSWQKLGCGVLCFVRDNNTRGYFFSLFDPVAQEETLTEEMYGKFEYERPHPLFIHFEGQKDYLGINFFDNKEADNFVAEIDNRVQARMRMMLSKQKSRHGEALQGGAVVVTSAVSKDDVLRLSKQKQISVDTLPRTKDTGTKKTKRERFFNTIRGGKNEEKEDIKSLISAPITCQHVSSGGAPDKSMLMKTNEPQAQVSKEEPNSVAAAILKWVQQETNTGNVSEQENEKLLEEINKLLASEGDANMEEFKKILGLSPQETEKQRGSSIRSKKTRQPQAPTPNSSTSRRPSMPAPIRPTGGAPPPPNGGIPPPPPPPPPPPGPGVPRPPPMPANKVEQAPSTQPNNSDANANVMDAIRNAGGVNSLQKPKERAEDSLPPAASDGNEAMLDAIRNFAKNNLKKVEDRAEENSNNDSTAKSSLSKTDLAGGKLESLMDHLRQFRQDMYNTSSEDEDSKFDDSFSD